MKSSEQETEDHKGGEENLAVNLAQPSSVGLVKADQNERAQVVVADGESKVDERSTWHSRK